MKMKSSAMLMVLLLAGLPAAAQRARRPAPGENSQIEVTRSATLRVSLSSDPGNIFEYLVDARKLEQWFPDQAVSEAQLGGKYHFRWNNKPGVWSGHFTYFIRGNTLGFTWQPPGEENETNVQFKLTPQGKQTLVELTHSGFVSNAEMDRALKAWVFYLENLKSVIEEGTDLRRETRPKPARRTSRGARR